MEISKQDWKLYRQKLPVWQEAYMARLLQEYQALLASEGLASEKFWDLKKRINQDALHPGVIVSIRRSNAIYNIAVMLHDGVITAEELDGFSDELIEAVRFLTGETL